MALIPNVKRFVSIHSSKIGAGVAKINYFNNPKVLIYYQSNSINAFLNSKSLLKCKQNKFQEIHVGLPSSITNCSYWKHFIREKSNAVFDISDLPEPPKKPLSPFLAYLNQERKDNPGVVLKIKSGNISELWNKLDEKEKSKYKEAYQKELAVYKERLAKYNSSLSVEEKHRMQLFILEKKKEKLRKESDKLFRIESKFQIKEAESLGKPKYPGNTLIIYWRKLNENIVGEKKLSMSEAIEKWNILTEDEKKIYKEIFQVKIQVYNEELESWERKMIECDKSHFVRKSTLNKIKKSTLD